MPAIYRYLTYDGAMPNPADDTLWNAKNDYTSFNSEFYYKNTEYLTCEIHRLLISIEDAGNFDSAAFGNGITLTNGIEIKHFDAAGAVITDFTGGLFLKTNGHLGRLFYDIDLVNFGVGNQILNGRFTFAKSGSPCKLKNGERIGVIFRDDFTGVVSHTYMIQGWGSN